jgi:hypothetical protein
LIQGQQQDRSVAFIQRWAAATGSELANSQSFVRELCDLLGVEPPHPATDDPAANAYVFERAIAFQNPDGSTSPGRIDLYRRECFVLESKKVKAGPATKGFDDALLRARTQAENYARALPAAEGRPPFVVVVDVGNVIELYAEFTRSGATYTAFPDARSHRIPLARLAEPEVQARLRALWLDPMSLDPSRITAQVTREVAAKLATLARELEGAGHSAERVAAFLTRCLFSMFAEDVGLLPKAPSGSGAFVHILRTHRDQPETLRHMLRALWTDMDRGGFSPALAAQVLRFNGKLFKGWAADEYVLPMSKAVVDGLIDAASSDWRNVEPAIIGTLLERALDPVERHRLGAHYTPRAYVERLVLPTVVEPLRAEWANVQAAALLLATEAQALGGRRGDTRMDEARAEVRQFHHRLCTVKVLDPACGSGNFLYVTMEHLKRLETEVLDQLQALGDSQAKLGLEGETVTPQQFLGIELNERAAALAELVLWIGFLQWHVRSAGSASVAEPVIHDYGNIECRDAVLTWEAQVPMSDDGGNLVTRWDGSTFKLHPVTGAKVPDERALVPQWRYVNPRPAEWPLADFIVGNPPFIGKLKLREALGDGYIEALRGISPNVPDSADLVMYWWDRAADLVRSGAVQRFGLISTNSIRQSFNRRVLQHHMGGKPALMLPWAVPDHPWVDSADGAAVRISMTVGAVQPVATGRLIEVVTEREGHDGEADVTLAERAGRILPNLRVGADVTACRPLRANAGLSSMGYILGGRGFVVEPDDIPAIAPTIEARALVHPLFNGKDIVARPRGLWVIDAHGLDESTLQARAPGLWQLLKDRVQPERAVNPDPRVRDRWWLFRRSNEQLREATAGLQRFIVTCETAKHRTFTMLPAKYRPEHRLIVIAVDDATVLGVLSSKVHEAWALAAGGTLEDRPVYNKSNCFDPFPFPSDDRGRSSALATRIGELADRMDTHRRTQQAMHADLTLTGMYNVLEKLRAGEHLSAKEREVYDHGLVGVLRTVHDELDAAVLDAYGWSDLVPALADYTPAGTEVREAAVADLLQRLVDLNAKRAAEEAAGTVRWLRPEFQHAASGAGTQAAIDVERDEVEAPAPTAAVPVVKRPWPSGLPEQIKAVSEVMGSALRPLTLDDLAAHFTARGRWRDRLPTIVETLEAIGRARRTGLAESPAWATA